MRRKIKLRLEEGRNVILSIIPGYCGFWELFFMKYMITTLKLPQSIMLTFLQNTEDLQ